MSDAPPMQQFAHAVTRMGGPLANGVAHGNIRNGHVPNGNVGNGFIGMTNNKVCHFRYHIFFNY